MANQFMELVCRCGSQYCREKYSRCVKWCRFCDEFAAVMQCIVRIKSLLGYATLFMDLGINV